MSERTHPTVVFAVKVRRDFLRDLVEMYKKSYGSGSLEAAQTRMSVPSYLAQLIESEIVHFRTLKMDAGAAVPAAGTRVADPEVRGGRGHPMFTAAECERVRRLSTEHGLNAVQIAGRFGGKLSVQVIRRILWTKEGEE
jgi:hypothetical protein